MITSLFSPLRLKEDSFEAHSRSQISLNGSVSSRSICMGILVKWFRFNSFVGLTFTALIWLLLCYQVLIRSNSLDENDSFNLVKDEFIVKDEKEVLVCHFINIIYAGNIL